MTKGFMFLHRQLLDWEWFDNSHMVHVWIYLLLKANYQEDTWHGIKIPRGSLVTSVNSISQATGLTTQNVRTCLSKLKLTGEITIKVTNQYSIVSISKYDSYNIIDVGANKQPNNHSNKQPNNQSTTDNNNNKDKDNKKEKEANASMSLFGDEPQEPSFDYEKFCAFFNETMKKHGSLIPQIRGIDSKRQGAIHARMKEYGESALYEVVKKAAVSTFMNGGSNRGWRADFNWIFGPTNFVKVLEGNYDDQKDTRKIQQPSLFETQQTNNEPQPQVERHIAYGCVFNTQAEADAFYDEQERIRNDYFSGKLRAASNSVDEHLRMGDAVKVIDGVIYDYE